MIKRQKNVETVQQGLEGITCLPLETWFHIATYLQVCDLQSLNRTNAFFWGLTNNHQLWEYLHHRDYKLVKQNTPRSRYLQQYNVVDWSMTTRTLTMLFRTLNFKFSRFRCNSPTKRKMIEVLTNGIIVEHNHDGLVEVVISDEMGRALSCINFDAVLFLIRNYQKMFEYVEFTKWDIWNGNDLVLIILATMDWRSISRTQEISRRVAVELVNRYPQHIATHLKQTVYRLETTGRDEQFTATGFRRLIYEGSYLSLKLLFRHIGTQVFCDEIQRIDEVNFCVLSEITGADEDRGERDVKTLEVLYEHFGQQLHQLVRRNLDCEEAPNAFWALTQTTNTAFIHKFLELFRDEGKAFVLHFRDQDSAVDMRDHDFQRLYAFVKAWCC
jgi:hypothetical protein